MLAGVKCGAARERRQLAASGPPVPVKSFSDDCRECGGAESGWVRWDGEMGLGS